MRKNDRAAYDANDYRDAGSSVVDRSPDKVEKTFGDAHKRSDWIKNQRARGRAQQGARTAQSWSARRRSPFLRIPLRSLSA